MQDKIKEQAAEISALNANFNNTPITFKENDWFPGEYTHGGRLRVPIVTNLSNVNISSSQMYVNDEWHDIPYLRAVRVGGTLYIMLDPTSVPSVTEGTSYLIRLGGTIS